eukprot:TRINITY_DN370_c0_g1_i1.p1 TRINITY_DN370_c0_g1~~TRINITY_DN370_c0_g1_i1.p1  ORF type:complete len:299 (-),score=111.39 TRINITY_DN370_c0_g1_i1:132-1028(-)
MDSLFGLIASNPIVEITLDGVEGRKQARIRDKDNVMKLPLYQGDDDISGVVEVKLNKAKKLEHLGVKIELIGRIEVPQDSKQSSDFMSIGKELESAGIILQDKTYKFSFTRFEKQYESYYGTVVKLRYFLRVTINRNYAPTVNKELDFAVYLPSTDMVPGERIKMEVGIEECLHIEFEYDKENYHLKDVVVGRVYFQLVKIKMKYMELCLIKRENLGAGTNPVTETETIAKFESMDGTPSKGEVIPLRMYLSAYDLTPTYPNVANNKFSVRYFLNLVLVDDEERRYFKQQEITLFRKK